MNDTVTYVGTEGIESWDLEDCEFLGYEIESRDLPFSWGETRARGDYSVPLVWLSNDWIDTKKENE